MGLTKSITEAPQEIEIDFDPDLAEANEHMHGHPTMLTLDLAQRICIRICQGDSLEDIEKIPGMPRERTVYRWLASTRTDERGQLYKAFSQAYARAKEMRATGRIGEISRIYKRLVDRSVEPSERLDAPTARVACELQRVLMEMEAPKVYGKQITLKGDAQNPVVVQEKAPTEMTMAELLFIASGGLNNKQLEN
jgi:hypothetical protein